MRWYKEFRVCCGQNRKGFTGFRGVAGIDFELVRVHGVSGHALYHLVTSFWRRSGGLRQTIRSECPLAGVVDQLYDCIWEVGGSLGRLLRRGQHSTLQAKLGIADLTVFPVPLLKLRLPHKGRAREETSHEVSCDQADKFVDWDTEFAP